MSETVITVEDAAHSLAALVERVQMRGEAALLIKSGRPVARIIPVPAPEPATEELIAFLRNWRLTHPEPDEQFAAAVEGSRKAVQPPHDPWEDPGLVDPDRLRTAAL